MDLTKPHRLRISMGSLYPDAADVDEWRARVEVTRDEVVVLAGVSECHPTTRTQILMGKNVIRESTCGLQFSVRIQRISRPAKP